MARTALTLVLIAALVAPQAGCSFLFVQQAPPAESRRRGEVDCTTSNVAPVLDMLIAGWQIVRTGLALSATDAQYRGAPFSRDTDITLGVSLTGLFVTSMIVGFGRTSDCREAMAEDSYPGSRPALRMAPPPRSQRKREEQDEEAAVQARSAEQAREAAKAGAAAGAAARAAPPPAKAPAMPQHNDTE